MQRRCHASSSVHLTTPLGDCHVYALKVDINSTSPQQQDMISFGYSVLSTRILRALQVSGNSECWGLLVFGFDSTSYESLWNLSTVVSYVQTLLVPKIRTVLRLFGRMSFPDLFRRKESKRNIVAIFILSIPWHLFVNFLLPTQNTSV